jgi:hypothetical protein
MKHCDQGQRKNHEHIISDKGVFIGEIIDMTNEESLKNYLKKTHKNEFSFTMFKYTPFENIAFDYNSKELVYFYSE